MSQPSTRDPTELRVVFSRQPLLIVGYAIGVAPLQHTAAFVPQDQLELAAIDARFLSELLLEPNDRVSTGLAEENG